MSLCSLHADCIRGRDWGPLCSWGPVELLILSTWQEMRLNFLWELGLNSTKIHSHPKLYFRAVEMGTHVLILGVGAGLAEMQSRHWERALAPILERNYGQDLFQHCSLSHPHFIQPGSWCASIFVFLPLVTFSTSINVSPTSLVDIPFKTICFRASFSLGHPLLSITLCNSVLSICSAWYWACRRYNNALLYEFFYQFANEIILNHVTSCRRCTDPCFQCLLLLRYL